MRQVLHTRAPIAALALITALSACDLFTDASRLERIALSPAAESTYVGATVRIEARALDGRGSALRDVAFTWSSADTGVATVDTAGVVLGRSPGTATILAQAQGVTGRATVSVMPGPFTAACSGQPAIRHTGAISAETWRAAAGLHLIADTLTLLGVLTIEAGAEVCTGRSAMLAFRSVSGELAAVGTAERPIRFRPADAAHPDFVVTSDPFPSTSAPTVRLSHVEAEHTSVRLGAGGLVVVDASRLGTVSAGYLSSVGVTGSVLGGASIASYAGMSLSNTVVRGGPVACSWRSSLALTQVRIEGSPTVGLAAEGPYGRECSVTIAGIRLVGNAAIASLDAASALALLSQPGIEDSLRGNLGDTLRVFTGGGSSPHGEEAVIPGYVHLWAPDGLRFAGSTMWVRPGARLSVAGFYGFSLPRVVAQGTAGQPVRIDYLPGMYGDRYIVQGGSATAPSVLSHVQVTGWGVLADSGHTLLVDSSRFSGGAGVILRSPGSRITGSLVEDASDSAAIVLGGDGVQLRGTVVLRTAARLHGTGIAVTGGNVVVDSCGVSGSTGDGILVTGGSGIRISHCNLVGNAGAGVNNVSGSVVDARDNWWGDPGGPTAPGAARVTGNVLYSPWATAPLQIGPRAGSVSLSPAAATVLTADTVRFQAVVRDSAGGLLPSAQLVWQVADTTVAVLDPQPGLLVGVGPGTTTLRVSDVANPATAAFASVVVSAGAPALRWSEETGLPPGSWAIAVWASSPLDVYAGGYSGIAHFDGMAWRQVVPDSGQIEVLWGRTAANVYAARLISGGYELLHFDGVAWRSLGNVSDQYVSGIWADSAGEIFLASGSLWHYRPGQGWSATGAAAGQGCLGVWGRSAREVYAACTDGVRRFDGSSWSLIGGMSNGHAIWGTANVLYVVGDSGRVQRYDGQSWTDMPSGTTRTLGAILGTGNSSIYARGPGVLRYFDGARWLSVWTWMMPGYEGLAVAGNEVYLGAGNVLLHGRPR